MPRKKRTEELAVPASPDKLFSVTFLQEQNLYMVTRDATPADASVLTLHIDYEFLEPDEYCARFASGVE